MVTPVCAPFRFWTRSQLVLENDDQHSLLVFVFVFSQLSSQILGYVCRGSGIMEVAVKHDMQGVGRVGNLEVLQCIRPSSVATTLQETSIKMSIVGHIVEDSNAALRKSSTLNIFY
ncbi:hypothetical protein FF1_013859 [Malus domestica]